MATLDDSPSLFSGESWSSWADFLHQDEANSEKTDTNCNESKSKDENDSVKLSREDMVLYGLCPAQDELFLAVCENCGQVVKPQALQRHIDIRHGQALSPKKKSPLNSKSQSRSHKNSKQSPGKSDKLFGSQLGQIHSEHSFPVVKVERMPSNVYSKPQQHSASIPSSADRKFEDVSLSLYNSESYHSNGEDLPGKEKSESKLFSHTLLKEEPSFKEDFKNYKEEPGGNEELIENEDKKAADSLLCANKTGIYTMDDIKASDQTGLLDLFHDKQKGIDLNEKESCKSEHAKFVDNRQERGIFREALFSSRHREYVGEDKNRKIAAMKLNAFSDENSLFSEEVKEEQNTKQLKEEHKFKESSIRKETSLGHGKEKSHRNDTFEQKSPKREKSSKKWGSDVDSKSTKTVSCDKKHKSGNQGSTHSGLHEKKSVHQSNHSDKDSSPKKKHSSKRSKGIQEHKPHSKKHHLGHKDKENNDDLKKKPKPDIIESFVPHVSDINQMYFVSNIKEERTSSPVSNVNVPECVEELTRKGEPPIPEMVDEAACAVEALNSQELVDKFEKMETDIEASLEIKHKMKVKDGTHIFQIDNRSSTPILHIPSPKSEPPSTPPPLSAPEIAHSLLLNGSVSVPNSKSSSRANSRPPSRQHSQTSTPLFKNSDTILFEDLNDHLSKLSSIQEAGFGNVIVKPIVTSSVSSTLSAITPVKNVSSSGSKKTTTKGEKFIPCKDRIYDPEKHCGAWVADQGRHCARSLTCKTHSLSLRRAVEGRSKPFDQLLQEHRDAKEALLKAKAAAASSSTTASTAEAAIKANRATMASKVVSMTTSTKVSHSGSVKMSQQQQQQQQQQQMAVVKQQQPVSNLLPFTHTPKPIMLSVFGQSKPLPMPEPGGQLSSEGEEEEEDVESTPVLLRHPRPAAVNNWGSRQYGRGCYMFNQSCDLLRSAFSSVVQVHNQAPPHKKQCLDSNQNQGIGGSLQFSKDPYEFSFGDNNSNIIQLIQGQNAQSTVTLPKQKSKLPITPLNKTVKHKDHTAISSSSKTLSSSSNKVSGTASMKRKRSGSGHALTSPPPNCKSMNITTLSSPISITIPAGINIANLSNAALSNTISAQFVPAKSTATQLHPQSGKANNLNIVVSGVDQPHQANIVNGQLLNLPGNISLDVSQLSSLTAIDRGPKGNIAAATKGTTKLLPNLQSKPFSYSALGKSLHTQQHQQSLQLDMTGSNSGRAGHLVTALPTGTVLMDTSGHSGNHSARTFLTSSQVATTATTNHHPSSATGFVFKKDSQLANGVLPHSGGIQLKNLPISINHHLNSNDQQQTPSPPTAITLNTDQRQLASKLTGRNHSMTGPRLGNLPKTMTATLKPAVQTHIPLSASTAQQIAATLNLGSQSGGRYIAPAGLQQMINPLQLQAAKTGVGPKTAGAGKMLQPMSLTIVTPPGGIAGFTGAAHHQHPLLINNSDTNSSKSELTDVVSSPASVT